MDYPNLKPLDELDRKIVRTLQADGRISNVELARRVSLSPPAVHARIRRLEEQGYITGYRGMVQREYLGYDMLCFVHVGTALNSPEQIGEALNAGTNCGSCVPELRRLIADVQAEPGGANAL